MDPYQTLANAVVMYATRDYRSILKKLSKHPKDPELQIKLYELEEFFLSSWFGILCDLDGKVLISQLRSTVAIHPFIPKKQEVFK